MEEETFFTGYCRQIDASRTVVLVTENGELTEVDCNYETCLYSGSCTIGKSISQCLETTNT